MFKKLISSPSLRSRTAWIVTAVLIGPFAIFFAANQLPFNRQEDVAGVIFGKSVSWDEFEREQRLMQRQFEQQIGGSLPDALQSMLTQSVWNKLILLEEAKRERLRVRDEELAEAIRKIPQFQDNGRFVPERYYTLLYANGLTPQGFEAQLRNDLLREKLMTGVKNAVTVGDEEVRAAYREARESLKASLALFDPAAFTDAAAAALTDEDVRAYAESHLETWRIPEQLTLEYAGRSREEIAATIQPADDEVRAFYDDHPERFATEDGTAKPFDEVKDAAREETVQERARKQLTLLALDLRDDLEAKQSFDEIVAQRALTPQTAGPIPKNNPFAPGAPPEPAILQAVEPLEEGGMADLIDTERGVYIARLTQRTASQLPELEEVRDKARDALIQERARAQANTAAASFRGRLTGEPPLRFEEAAAASGIVLAPVQFARDGSIGALGQAPAVSEAAFKTPLGTATEVLEAGGKFAVLRTEERVPADDAAFAQEEAEFRRRTLETKQAARTNEWMEDVRARAKLKDFAGSRLLTTTPPGVVLPDGR